MRRSLILALLLALAPAGTASASVPTRFSSCDRLASFDGRTGAVVVETDNVYGGESSCRAMTGTAGTAKTRWNTSLASGDDFYFGVALKQGPRNTTVARLVSGTGYLRIRLDASGRAIVQHNDQTLAGPVDLPRGCWSHLEVHAHLSGTAPRTQLYRNGMLIDSDTTHANYSGSRYTKADFGAIGTSTAQALDFDRVSLGPTRSGGKRKCGAIPRPCGRTASPPTTWKHVVWVVMENKSYSKIIGSSAAPYLNRLASECGLATNYHAVTHPSLPNYIALTSGSTQGVIDNAWPSSHLLTAPSIFSQLGLGWRSLQESMPSNCLLEDAHPYAVRHNPAAYFTNIRAACLTRDVPLRSTPDISARFTQITPNVCNDTHDCPIKTGDNWLSKLVPKLLASSQYRAGNTLVVITWDEDDYDATNHIPTVVIAPTTRVGVRYRGALDHYSLLRTAQQMLGLPCLANSCSAVSMRAGFNL